MMKRLIFGIIFMCILGYSLYGAHPKKTRLKVKSVTYQGNEHFRARQLNNIIISRPSTWISPSYYNDDLFQGDLAGIPQFYQQNGYLEAKLTDYNVDIDSSKKSVKIDFIIEEGKEKVTFSSDFFNLLMDEN